MSAMFKSACAIHCTAVVCQFPCLAPSFLFSFNINSVMGTSQSSMVKAFGWDCQPWSLQCSIWRLPWLCPISTYCSNANTVYYHLEKKLCFTNHGLFYYFLLGGYFPGLLIIKYFKLISMSVSKELCCYSALISVDNLVIIPTPWFETV